MYVLFHQSVRSTEWDWRCMYGYLPTALNVSKLLNAKPGVRREDWGQLRTNCGQGSLQTGHLKPPVSFTESV